MSVFRSGALPPRETFSSSDNFSEKGARISTRCKASRSPQFTPFMVSPRPRGTKVDGRHRPAIGPAEVDQPAAKQVAFQRSRGLKVNFLPRLFGDGGQGTLQNIGHELQGEMAAAGMRVTWFPLDGGHEIPKDLVTTLNEFLAHL